MDPVAEAEGGPERIFRLDGKVVVLTGASSGLGWRFAHVLHGAGARVVVTARRADRLDALVAALPGIAAVVGDVTDSGDRSRIIGAAERFGPVDVLVNNAGVVLPAKADEEPLESFRQVLEVNLVATFALTQLVIPQMRARARGSVVNVASVLGLVGSRKIPLASYAASKGGVVNLTRELAAQCARAGVRVNAIAPGWFLSEMTGEFFESARGRQFIEEETPMGRPGAPDELDGALLYLASDASSFVTGQVLAVDGGWTAV